MGTLKNHFNREKTRKGAKYQTGKRWIICLIVGDFSIFSICQAVASLGARLFCF
jgi:hypothetical protein